MRSKRWVHGLDNSQKIRVICNGVGFNTTVQGAFDMCVYEQRVAVTSALSSLGCNQYLPEDRRPSGFATRIQCFNHEGKEVSVDVQVDLI